MHAAQGDIPYWAEHANSVIHRLLAQDLLLHQHAGHDVAEHAEEQPQQAAGQLEADVQAQPQGQPLQAQQVQADEQAQVAGQLGTDRQAQQMLE